MSTRIIKKEISAGFYQRIYIQIIIVKYCVCNVGGLVGSNISLFSKCGFPQSSLSFVFLDLKCKTVIKQ